MNIKFIILLLALALSFEEVSTRLTLKRRPDESYIPRKKFRKTEVKSGVRKSVKGGLLVAGIGGAATVAGEAIKYALPKKYQELEPVFTALVEGIKKVARASDGQDAENKKHDSQSNISFSVITCCNIVFTFGATMFSKYWRRQ